MRKAASVLGHNEDLIRELLYEKKMATKKITEAETEIRVLNLSAKGHQDRVAKLEKENAEAHVTIEQLVKSSEEAKVAIAGAQKAADESKKAAEEAKQLNQNERRAREEAERKMAEAERNAKVAKLSLENLQKDYEEAWSSLKAKKDDLLKASEDALQMEEEFKSELAAKDKEIDLLKQQLTEAKNLTPSSEVISEAVKKATADLKASFDAQIPRIKTLGAREWRDTTEYKEAMEQHNGSYAYAAGASWVRSEMKRTGSLDLDKYRINGIERMTTSGMTLLRPKVYPYPINLPDTPADMREALVTEYEYWNSSFGEDELPGLPADYYTHLRRKHHKIKTALEIGALPDENDPDLYYGSEPSPSEVPSTPSSSTPASAEEVSSDAGLGSEVEGEEVTSGGAEEAQKAAAESIVQEAIESAAEKLLEETADKVISETAAEGGPEGEKMSADGS